MQPALTPKFETPLSRLRELRLLLIDLKAGRLSMCAKIVPFCLIASRMREVPPDSPELGRCRRSFEVLDRRCKADGASTTSVRVADKLGGQPDDPGPNKCRSTDGDNRSRS